MLRKEEILNRINNGLFVFKYYLFGDWCIGRYFFNLFYQDRKVLCNIYFDCYSGMYKMKDFGNDNYSGDCFFFVGQLKGLDCNQVVDFVEILEIIDWDLGLGLGLVVGILIVIFIIVNNWNVVDKIEEIFEKLVKFYQFWEQKFLFVELMYW